MKSLSTIFLDGKFIKIGNKTLEVFTPGIFQAQGVFETMLAVGQEVFDVASHLKRLRGAFKGVRVSKSIIEQVVKLNGFEVSRVRVIAWKEGQHKHVVVMALKHVLTNNKEYKVCLIKTSRQAHARFSNIKSLDYKIFADAYQMALSQGFDEALLINNKGYVFEASRSNVFWFKENRMYTPPLSSGCLNGIMRSKVIKYARKFKISFQEKIFSVEELKAADRVFLTNSLIGIKVLKNSFPFLPR